MGPRPVRAPRGTTLSAKGWQQEAALRMLMNNLDPEVAEHPDELIVYGGAGPAAGSWGAVVAMVPSPPPPAGGGTTARPARPPGGGLRPPPRGAPVAPAPPKPHPPGGAG